MIIVKGKGLYAYVGFGVDYPDLSWDPRGLALIMGMTRNDSVVVRIKGNDLMKMRKIFAIDN